MATGNAGASGNTVGNFSNLSESTQQSDNSQVNSTIQSLQGAQVSAGEASTINYTGSDFGALGLAGQAFNSATDLAETGIINTAKSQQGITQDSLLATEKALDLAGQAAQGQNGTLIHGLIWIVGLVAAAFGLTAIAKYSRKAAANA
jgi:hypothetical protein